MSETFGSKIAKVSKFVSIVDLAEEAGCELIEQGNGNFKCRCPIHKNGLENTPSFFIYPETNSFHCFGCKAGSNVIDFYRAITDMEFVPAVNQLYKRLNSKYIDLDIKLPEKKDNFLIKLEISTLIRNTLQEHPEDLKWLAKFLKRITKDMQKLKRSDIARANNILDAARNAISKRYSKEE